MSIASPIGRENNRPMAVPEPAPGNRIHMSQYLQFRAEVLGESPAQANDA
jgi:hypothetical protein